MTIETPLFIVGTGRCGSTIFHDVLCHHYELAWLSQYCDRYPGKPRINARIMSCLEIPLLTTTLRKLIYPTEPYKFWERYCPGFSRPFRDLKSTDVTPRVILKVRSAFQNSIPANKRLLVKITGWPRIGLLKTIFPDAKFVHIIRDGRAVVNSVIAAPYFDGWAGPHNWTRGEINENQRIVWEKSGMSYVILAAIGWENRMNAFESAKKNIPDGDYLEIKYEKFCARPIKILEDVLDFAGLSEDPNFLKKASQYSLVNTNDKWKVDLSEVQQTQLNNFIAPILARYDYI